MIDGDYLEAMNLIGMRLENDSGRVNMKMRQHKGLHMVVNWVKENFEKYYKDNSLWFLQFCTYANLKGVRVLDRTEEQTLVKHCGELVNTNNEKMNIVYIILILEHLNKLYDITRIL